MHILKASLFSLLTARLTIAAVTGTVTAHFEATTGLTPIPQPTLSIAGNPKLVEARAFAGQKCSGASKDYNIYGQGWNGSPADLRLPDASVYSIGFYYAASGCRLYVCDNDVARNGQCHVGGLGLCVPIAACMTVSDKAKSSGRIMYNMVAIC
ncbi:uncharacterized protein AB675_11870 [Cyphellophora attinorum]|uniref:Uncharacterized protein n=1 Tax=Cyphellophora attinorum TaxID=1664694 RepID=A0A0N1H6D0_9EURO|nr:uncharacterized protein AB675_11870 [Phialophora attinorum]KPI36862.1 hypothetical protein AB675_11870 [Phialophora attinorum]